MSICFYVELMYIVVAPPMVPVLGGEEQPCTTTYVIFTASLLLSSALYLLALVESKCNMHILHEKFHILELSRIVFWVFVVLVAALKTWFIILSYDGCSWNGGYLKKDFLKSFHDITYHVGIVNIYLFGYYVYD